MYKTKLSESSRVRKSIIEALTKTLYDFSHEYELHNKCLIKLSHLLGKTLSLSSEQLHNLKLMALLHDIGFSALPKDIVDKKNPLNPEEDELMKNHCEIGYRIASSLSNLAYIANDILSHHEEWDGSGYPQGLSGENIPLNSRIFSILRTYALLTHNNLSPEAVDKQSALLYIKENANKRFDPSIADKFIHLMENISSY